MKMDADEKELLESVERDEWKSAARGLRQGHVPEGPYQTLIASLLHQYATGRLKEI